MREESHERGLPVESVHHTTNGVRLHVIEAGPEDGPLLVLLHGFPEFWYGWHSQIRPLAREGFRVVVPDQRGYNLSEKPRGLDAYRIDELAADVRGLVDAYGRERASVVGHDWGAAVAWWLALTSPERVNRLGVLNVPHPAVFQRAIRERWDQRLRSWYMLFFQLPVVPEAALRLDGYRLLERAMDRTSRPGTFSADDFEWYRRAWSQPGAVTTMLNWYRALARRPSTPPARTRVDVPTRIIWGGRDRFIGRDLARESAALCERGRLVLLDEATHWVQHEEADRVTSLLLEFLTRSD